MADTRHGWTCDFQVVRVVSDHPRVSRGAGGCLLAGDGFFLTSLGKEQK